MTPTGTVGLIAGGGAGAALVQYVVQLAHMPPMTEIVAGAVAAIVAGGVHWSALFISTRFPAESTPPAPSTDAPLAHPAPVATP